METTQCIVETPKGSGIKYEYCTKLACFQLGKMLPAGVTFPYDFGFIPGTIGEDGDPLDVIIVSDMPTFTGCAVHCRIIGSIKASQVEPNGDEVRNDRFLAIPVKDGSAAAIEELEQLPSIKLDELEQFFVNYNEQAGKQFKPLSRLSASAALKEIEKGRKLTEPTKLIQVLLPLHDSEGIALPPKLFKAVKDQLLEKFGAINSYVPVPAEGWWKESANTVVNDQLIIYEVMVADIDKNWWKKYKKELKLQFAQNDIVIRQSQIGLL